MHFKHLAGTPGSLGLWVVLAVAALPQAALAATAAAHPSPPHIIVISLDATRADHLSLYGYPLSTSPNLDRFAGRAVVFENARTVVPLTGPSHASLFTARYPHTHGAFRNGIPLKDSWTPLAEHLRASGYDTAAFVSGWTLRGKLCGLQQGFDVYDDRIPHRYKIVNRERYAAETNQAVRAYLDARAPGDRPLFLFVHYFDPHDPYRKHPSFLPGLQAAARDAPPPFPPALREKVLAYDSELAYMDLHLGAMLQLLSEKGLLTDALIVILADHGESLGEHGYWGHGRRVYDQMLRIPLVLYAPGRLPAPRRISPSVNTLDVVPTLLALADLPPLPGDLVQGRDLSAFLRRGEPLPPHRVYFETFQGTIKRFTKLVFGRLPKAPMLMGYEEDGLKHIYSPDHAKLEIYDLRDDPGEKADLAPSSPPPALVSHLAGWYRSSWHAAPVRARLSREEIEQMRSLGYID